METTKNPFNLNLQPELYAMFEELNILRPIKSIEPFYYRGIPENFIPDNINGVGYILSKFSSFCNDPTQLTRVALSTLGNDFTYYHDRLFSTIGEESKSIESLNYISTRGLNDWDNLIFVIAIGFKTTFEL